MGYISLDYSDKDIMSKLSKDGTVIHPTAITLEKSLLATKYEIFKDMADTQTRYRQQIDNALVI